MLKNNIKSMFRSHFVLLLICIVLQTTSCLALLYSYCEYKQTQFDVQQYKNHAGQFFVDIEDDIYVNVKDQIEKIENELPMDIKSIKLFLDKDYKIQTVMQGIRIAVNYGNDFSQTNEKEVIIPLKMQIENGYSIGSKITILNNQYKITGIRKNDDIEVKNTTIDDSQNITAFEISLNTIPTKKEIEYIEYLIESNVTSKDLIVPSERNIFDEMSFDSKLIGSFLLVILSIVNINMIYSYLINQRKIQNSVYRVCGISRFRLILLNIIEFLIYLLTSIVLAILLFVIINKKLKLFGAVTIYEYYIACSLFTIVSLYSGIEKIVFSLKDEPVSSIFEGRT